MVLLLLNILFISNVYADTLAAHCKTDDLGEDLMFATSVNSTDTTLHRTYDYGDKTFFIFIKDTHALVSKADITVEFKDNSRKYIDSTCDLLVER